MYQKFTDKLVKDEKRELCLQKKNFHLQNCFPLMIIRPSFNFFFGGLSYVLAFCIVYDNRKPRVFSQYLNGVCPVSTRCRTCFTSSEEDAVCVVIKSRFMYDF